MSDGDTARAVNLTEEPTRAESQRPALITGGAGFIGSNVANRLLASGQRVILYDNLSRNGVGRNVTWLRETYGDRVEVVVGDIRDFDLLRQTVERAGQVFHFAAQVAVTSSLLDPIEDFNINARGALNLLESIRATAHRPPLLFTSTNKVYGALDDVELTKERQRYRVADPRIADAGIDESRPLDCHSPYGCSKGTADNYIIDYSRSFGLRAVVFRMSCIYGPRQCGTEDQGWVAHFLIRALERKPVTLYGDGCQVRDILFVDDLINAMLLAQANVDRLSGQAFNIGGGPQHTVSLRELLDLISEMNRGRLHVEMKGWRTGDQRYYVSNTTKFSRATGWMPTVDVRTGVYRLYEWLAAARGIARRPRRPNSRTPFVPASNDAHETETLATDGAA